MKLTICPVFVALVCGWGCLPRICGQPAGLPLITTQPISVVVQQGESFVFGVGISTPGDLQPTGYRWYRDGEPVGSGNVFASLYARFADAGVYTIAITNAVGTVTSQPATLTVLPVSRLINLSVRARVGGVAGPLTLGLAVRAPGMGTHLGLLFRGVGPGLADFGVPGTLPDPQLAVFTDGQRVLQNDNWGGTAQITRIIAAAGAFPLRSESKDAVGVTTVAAGTHTLRIDGVAGSGLALGEIYDTTPAEGFSIYDVRLSNLSALAFTGTGTDRLQAGFVLLGARAKKILLRAVGPGLANAGVTTATLANPQLTLFGADGVKLGENDDWSGDPEVLRAFAVSGAFALTDGSRDAVLLRELAPGAYTIAATGVGNTTGLVLIEVYDLPDGVTEVLR